MSDIKPLISKINNHANTFFSNLQIEETILFVIILLSIIGVAITDYAPSASWAYWIFMTAALCTCAVVIEKALLHRKDVTFTKLVITQLIHWGVTLLAIIVSFSFVSSGRITYEGSGLIILLILSLSTFLDGYHVGWRFYLAGVFLGITTVLAAYVEEFMWILFAIGMASLFFASYLEKYLTTKRLEKPKQPQ
ncbi:MAG: hypothetical protein PHW13_12685 [Methylococcales bacterium]|nr:hypothetical protein [Methylococcales bacterium]